MTNFSIIEELNQTEHLIRDGKIKEALKLITKFEQDALVQSLEGDLNSALEVYLKCKELYDKIGNKTYIATNYSLLGVLYLRIGDFNAGLDYGMRCLKLWEDLNNQEGIAAGLSLVGQAYNYKGNLDLAIDFCKRSLTIKEISSNSKMESLHQLGVIFFWKGELRQSLKYCKKSLNLAEKSNNNFSISSNLNQIGIAYFTLGENDSAIKYLERGLKVSEKIGFIQMIGITLAGLILIFDTISSPNQAKWYLKRLKEYADARKENRFLNHTYMVSRALIMISSGRSRDRAEAESLLQYVVEEKISHPTIYLMALTNLLTFLLDELRISNNIEVLDDMNPLITRYNNITEKTNSFFLLAQGKLFEAKLALVQLEFDKAKKLLTEGQRIAEYRGFFTSAQMISNEHDFLLRQQDIWEDLKKKNTPISERINLASFDSVLDHMRGRRAVIPPEIAVEEPILLLIMDRSGATFFNHPFIANWDHSDLFSSFLSAFNTFSDEIFSKSIDRIRIGENTILINPVENYLVCYVIKGQSYPALQKLTRFTEAIRENTEIWQALNRSVKTSEMLELDKPPALKTVINEIFTH